MLIKKTFPKQTGYPNKGAIKIEKSLGLKTLIKAEGKPEGKEKKKKQSRFVSRPIPPGLSSFMLLNYRRPTGERES